MAGGPHVDAGGVRVRPGQPRRCRAVVAFTRHHLCDCRVGATTRESPTSNHAWHGIAPAGSSSMTPWQDSRAPCISGLRVPCWHPSKMSETVHRSKTNGIARHPCILHQRREQRGPGDRCHPGRRRHRRRARPGIALLALRSSRGQLGRPGVHNVAAWRRPFLPDGEIRPVLPA